MRIVKCFLAVVDPHSKPHIPFHGIISGIPHFTVLHLLCFTNVAFFLQIEGKNPPSPTHTPAKGL